MDCQTCSEKPSSKVCSVHYRPLTTFQLLPECSCRDFHPGSEEANVTDTLGSGMYVICISHVISESLPMQCYSFLSHNWRATTMDF